MARVGVEAMVLTQHGWQIGTRSVNVARGLEDEAGHRAARAGATRQQVERADDIHLMGAMRIHVERIDPRQRVYNGVDPDRPDQLADERVADVEIEVVGAAQVVARLAGVDADNLGDIRIIDQALHDQRTPPPSHPGDENSPLLRCHRYLVCIRSV